MSRRKVQPIAPRAPRPLESDLALLVDDAAWREVGAELRQADPKRYVELLKVAREIVEIHRDPLVRFEKAGN